MSCACNIWIFGQKDRPTFFRTGTSLTYPVSPYNLTVSRSVNQFTWLLGSYNLTVDLSGNKAAVLQCPKSESCDRFLPALLTRDVNIDQFRRWLRHNSGNVRHIQRCRCPTAPCEHCTQVQHQYWSIGCNISLVHTWQCYWTEYLLDISDITCFDEWVTAVLPNLNVAKFWISTDSSEPSAQDILKWVQRLSQKTF